MGNGLGKFWYRIVAPGTVGSSTRNGPRLSVTEESAPRCATTFQRYWTLRSSGSVIVNVVSTSPPTPYVGNGCPSRITNMSYRNGPGGAATAGERQVNVGWMSGVAVPCGLSSVVRVTHAGTAIGPTRPVDAVTAMASVASTRQKIGP